MNEIKRPKTPLIFYYLIVLLIIMLVNALVMPKIAEHAVQEVDYGTFMSMTEKGEIGKVQLQSNQILFTNKDETTVYKTGLMNDPGLVERLYASGAEFTSEIIEQASPLVTLLFSWLLPIIIFVVLGQFLSKKMMDKAGGGPGSLMFNMGKSNAKIYVKSSDGIRFSDVEGVDEAEENLQEIVDYLHNPQKYQEIGASMPKGVPEVSGNRCLHAQGRPSGRPSGNRQNHARKGRGRRSQCSVFLNIRLGIRRDVCRHGCLQSPRSVQAGQGESALHRVYR